MDTRRRLASPLAIGALIFALLAGTQEPTPSALNPEQQELIDFALLRFAAQGLDLPDVEIEFRSSATECDGHTGFYSGGTGRVTMCRLDEKTMLHELAHAWLDANLTEAEKQEFSRFMGVTAWNDTTLDWDQRGVEIAADIIAWALMERPVAMRFEESTEEGGTGTVYRLLTLPELASEELHRGFVALTGMQLVFRPPTEWDRALMEAEWQETVASVISPEANRVTN